uniref:Uncharacterized protein n=1 Tax=Lactuca sativa TaxID=4236 RepID=A0A9R1W350_LACSA|nr:hypothetical protein LSAT_V11C300153110 [Lactuca sativa]
MKKLTKLCDYGIQFIFQVCSITGFKSFERVMDVICATNSKSLGQNRLLDAYHLLQTDASVQKLVLSISSDIEVWDAILKNDEVRDLRRSLPYTEVAMGRPELGSG